jgi:hypothetical protein
MKTCTKCGIEKPISEYYKDVRKGREGKFRPRCRTCLNAEVMAARKPEKRREAVRRWESRNPEKAAKYRKTAVARWASNNKDSRQASDAKRKAAKIQATPEWADQAKIKEFYAAADFLGMVTGEWHHVDHIVPLRSTKVCGLHTEQNLQVLPASDNLRKSNRHWPDMP